MNDKCCHPETHASTQNSICNSESDKYIYESKSELGFQSKCFPAALPSEEITHLESLAEVPLGHGQNFPIASPGENQIPALPKD